MKIREKSDLQISFLSDFFKGVHIKLWAKFCLALSKDHIFGIFS